MPSAGTQQQLQLQNKFRLCVWKYMPANPAMLGEFGASRQNSAGNLVCGAAASNGGGAGAATNRATSGNVASRWAMTPSASKRPGVPVSQDQNATTSAAPAFMRLHRDVVFSALSFLSTGELAIASQTCTAWFLLADPWVFLEHYGWVPLGPLSRASRVSLRLSRADNDVAPELFTALSQTVEHLQLEFVGGVPLCDRSSMPHLTRLKSLELLRPSQHDIGQIAASMCAPLSGADKPAHRLHCLCINRAQVHAPQSTNFVVPLLALRASRLVIRRTVTLLPSALRLLTGSHRFPQMVLDRCIVLPTTEAPVLAADQEEPQMLVSGIVDDTPPLPAASAGSQSAPASSTPERQPPQQFLPRRPVSPPCELPCCNFYVDSALRPVRTPVAQMSRRRLFRLLVSQGRVATATTSDEESLSSRGTVGASSGYFSDSRGDSSMGGGGGGRSGDTPLIASTTHPHPFHHHPGLPLYSSLNLVQQQVVVPKGLCLQCLIWEKPCKRHSE